MNMDEIAEAYAEMALLTVDISGVRDIYSKTPRASIMP